MFAVIFAPVLLGSKAVAGDYYVIGVNDEALYLLDMDSVKPAAETYAVTAPAILAVPESFYGGKMTRRHDNRWALDCATRSVQMLGFDLRSGTGELHSKNDVKTEWGRPKPGTIGVRMLQIVCDGWRPAEPSEHFSDLTVAQESYYAVRNLK